MVIIMKFTTLCYIEKNDKYLMLYRNKKENDLNEGKWIGVGGKFEERESPEECLVREVKEETGITVKDIKYLGSDFVKGKELLMLTYLAYYESGEIEKSTEVEGAAWYNIEDALCELNEDSIGKRVVKKVLKEIGYEGTNAFRCEGNNCNV